jgi:hypothetical protein
MPAIKPSVLLGEPQTEISGNTSRTPNVIELDNYRTDIRVLCCFIFL